MSLREWLIIIGALVILGVLLDGVRRMIRARREARDFSHGMGSSDIGNSPLDDSFNPELPNGGSRVIEPGYDSGGESATPPPRPERQPPQYRPTRPITAGPSVAPRPLAGEPAPTPAPTPAPEAATEPEHKHDQQHDDDQGRDQDQGYHQDQDQGELSAVDTRSPLDHDIAAFTQDSSEPAPDEPACFQRPPTEVTDPVSQEDFNASPEERPNRPSPATAGSPVDDLAQGAKNLWNKLRTGAQSVTQAVEKPTSEGTTRVADRWRNPVPAATSDSPDTNAALGGKAPLAGANRPVAEEVIVINVHCKGEDRLPGPALKRLFEGCGLEYGDLSIYHRHEEPDTRSPVQFSVANAVSPGTFEAEEMATMATPGISFFLSLPGPDDAMQAFEFMLETAQTVVRNLGGELRDEQRSVMTGQTIEHCRQCIREYERRRHFVRHH